MKREPHVSNHALLRYIERVWGVDINRARDEILTPTTRAAIKLGARAVIIDGHRCVVADNGTITTIFPRPNGQSNMGRATVGRAR